MFCKMDAWKSISLVLVTICPFFLNMADGGIPHRTRRAIALNQGETANSTLQVCLGRQLIILDSRLQEQNAFLDARLDEQNSAVDNRLDAQNTALDTRLQEHKVILRTIKRQNKALDDHLTKLNPTLDKRLLELNTAVDTRLQALHTDTVAIVDTRLQEQYASINSRFLEQKALFDALQVQTTTVDSRLMEMETAVETRLLALHADILKLADGLAIQRSELEACIHSRDDEIQRLKVSSSPARDEEVASTRRGSTQQSEEISALRNLTIEQMKEINRMKDSLAFLNSTVLGNRPANFVSDGVTAEQPVAFTVRFNSESIRGLGAGQTLRFDNVVYNAGNAYDPATGLFTAPSSGTYVFFVQVMRHRDDSTVQADIYKGDTLLARAEGCCSLYGTGSTMAVSHVQAGETVRVQANKGSSLNGGVYSSFSGFKLA